MPLRTAAAYLPLRQRGGGGSSSNWPSVMGEPLLVPMLVVLAVV